MRLFCTYILLVALTLQSFYRSILAIDYQTQLPEYLAKCINKNRPQIHCNGQCVLMQKIREKEKQDTKKNIVVYEYSALYVHKEHTIFQSQNQPEETTENYVSPYLTNYAYTYRTSIFRPPIA